MSRASRFVREQTVRTEQDAWWRIPDCGCRKLAFASTLRKKSENSQFHTFRSRSHFSPEPQHTRTLSPLRTSRPPPRQSIPVHWHAGAPVRLSRWLTHRSGCLVIGGIRRRSAFLRSCLASLRLVLQVVAELASLLPAGRRTKRRVKRHLLKRTSRPSQGCPPSTSQIHRLGRRRPNHQALSPRRSSIRSHLDSRGERR